MLPLYSWPVERCEALYKMLKMEINFIFIKAFLLVRNTWLLFFLLISSYKYFFLKIPSSICSIWIAQKNPPLDRCIQCNHRRILLSTADNATIWKIDTKCKHEWKLFVSKCMEANWRESKPNNDVLYTWRYVFATKRFLIASYSYPLVLYRFANHAIMFCPKALCSAATCSN